MSESATIVSYVYLKNNFLSVNGNEVILSTANDIVGFSQSAYEYLQTNYPKFFKMDTLCKTGFIACEFLLQSTQLSKKYKPEEIGIIFSNANASLDTDIHYQQSIAIAPSPSLFVYTLPNVLIGELCIRHKIKGETACFVFDIFDGSFQTDYVNLLLETGRIKACISGWGDFYNNKAEAFFYLVEKGEGELKHSKETINQIWNNYTKQL